MDFAVSWFKHRPTAGPSWEKAVQLAQPQCSLWKSAESGVWSGTMRVGLSEI